jgi:hypothetical protein
MLSDNFDSEAIARQEVIVADKRVKANVNQTIPI